MEKQLVEILKRKPQLSNLAARLDDARERFGPIKTFFSRYTNPIGIELEMESCPRQVVEDVRTSSYFWDWHEDGSLKLDGAEFVSSPLMGQSIDYAIHEMSVLLRNIPILHSVRTSTHVHVNVAYMTPSQLSSLVLISAMVEPLLYKMCDKVRRNNPYCYSITELLPSIIKNFEPDMKYCGINLAPVNDRLTVEYRQLHGTTDWRLLRRWIQLLCKIQYYAASNPHKLVVNELTQAIGSDNYESFLKKLFGASCVLFDDVSICQENAAWVLATIDYLETV